jgi:ketosteroid isomerase-like protein
MSLGRMMRQSTRMTQPAAAALYTEDAVLLTPRGPIVGQKAIEKWYADVFKGWHPKDHVGKGSQEIPPVFGTAGTEAWDTGEWSETGQGKSGDPESIKGYWSSVDIREGDSWKIRLLTYNVTPAPVATPSPNAVK